MPLRLSTARPAAHTVQAECRLRSRRDGVLRMRQMVRAKFLEASP